MCNGLLKKVRVEKGRHDTRPRVTFPACFIAQQGRGLPGAAASCSLAARFSAFCWASGAISGRLPGVDRPLDATSQLKRGELLGNNSLKKGCTLLRWLPFMSTWLCCHAGWAVTPGLCTIPKFVPMLQTICMSNYKHAMKDRYCRYLLLNNSLLTCTET
jgi:hypothetical protein